MAGIKGLAHIGVFTVDLQKSLEFYCDTLGFEKINACELGTSKLGFVRAGSCVIELIQQANYKGDRTSDGVVAHIAIEVEDIRGVVASLKKKGVRFSSEDVSVIPKLFPTGSTNIFFNGPNGESLELYEYKGA